MRIAQTISKHVRRPFAAMIILALMFLVSLGADNASAATARPAVTPTNPTDALPEELREDGQTPAPKPATQRPRKASSWKELKIEEIMAKRAKSAKDIPPIKMKAIHGGCFDMGDSTGDGDPDERPVHQVCVSSFYLSDVEVTQELFEKVLGYNPVVEFREEENIEMYAPFKGPQKPVVLVVQRNIKGFIDRLNELTKGNYRLPTEAEWEFAAREGGRKKRWSGTDDEDAVAEYGWYEFNSGGALHDVKSRRPNALGIYDMTGNVAELCEDFFDFDFYSTTKIRRDPLQDIGENLKVLRGGSFISPLEKARNSYRYPHDPKIGQPFVGFRLAQ